jgi:Zn-dependent protease with chaperone function
MNLFSTHPPMDKRIAALARMESELQGTVGRAVPVAV